MSQGTPPVAGPQLIDGTWAQGVANGVNNSYQNGLTANNTTQATGTSVPAGIAIVEFDTVANNGVAVLPFAYQGTEFTLINNGSHNLTLDPQIGANPITGAVDTINGSTSATVNSGTVAIVTCAKNGAWFTK